MSAVSMARVKLIEDKTFLGVDAYGHATVISSHDFEIRAAAASPVEA